MAVIVKFVRVSVVLLLRKCSRYRIVLFRLSVLIRKVVCSIDVVE